MEIDGKQRQFLIGEALTDFLHLRFYSKKPDNHVFQRLATGLTPG